ncbi:MAG: hypothetical protein IK066_09370 [Kiritimatiellae bacterium]|nr:hypothetical protein [Kiritimatiellia bacterium]
MAAHAWHSEEADALVEAALRGIAEDVGGLGLRGLKGVVLGGGYGRGEGGVWEHGGPRKRSWGGAGDFGLSNDMDFFAVAERGAGERTAAAIGRALEPVAAKWTAALGVDVEFSPKTPERLKHDEKRLMVQELLRGHCDVWGAGGAELFAGVERREAAALPWSEAARLLVNRGAVLLTVKEAGRDAEYVARNIGKAVLAAGDARLMARGAYRWRAEERAAALGEELYARALDWKFRPKPEPPCDWEEAQKAWLDAVAVVRAAGEAGGRERTFREAARWVARRRTLGHWRTLGWEPVARILEELEDAVRKGDGLPEEMRKDWVVFN